MLQTIKIFMTMIRDLLKSKTSWAGCPRHTPTPERGLKTQGTAWKSAVEVLSVLGCSNCTEFWVGGWLPASTTWQQHEGPAEAAGHLVPTGSALCHGDINSGEPVHQQCQVVAGAPSGVNPGCVGRTKEEGT